MIKIKYLIKSTFIILLLALASIGNAFTISPPRTELTGNPGVILNGIIKLSSDQEDTTLYASYEDLETPEETNGTYNSGLKNLADWISSKSTISLKAGEQISLPYTITIPKNAKSGNYFATIFYSSTPSTKQPAADTKKIGMFIILHVTGENIVKNNQNDSSYINKSEIIEDVKTENNSNINIKDNINVDIIDPTNSIKKSFWTKINDFFNKLKFW